MVDRYQLSSLTLFVGTINIERYSFVFISVVNNDKWNESDIYFNHEASLDDTYGNIKGVSNLKIIRKM